jgi:hypothetical protein
MFLLLSATCAAAQILQTDKRDGRLKLELKSDWLPSTAEVARVESLLKVPREVGKLQDYERYWVGTFKNGRKRISGYLNSETSDSSSRRHISQPHIVKYAMVEFIADAGCEVIYIEYDLPTDRILKHQCGRPITGTVGPPGWR